MLERQVLLEDLKGDAPWEYSPNNNQIYYPWALQPMEGNYFFGVDGQPPGTARIDFRDTFIKFFDNMQYPKPYALAKETYKRGLKSIFQRFVDASQTPPQLIGQLANASIQFGYHTLPEMNGR